MLTMVGHRGAVQECGIALFLRPDMAEVVVLSAKVASIANCVL